MTTRSAPLLPGSNYRPSRQYTDRLDTTPQWVDIPEDEDGYVEWSGASASAAHWIADEIGGPDDTDTPSDRLSGTAI